LAIGDSISADFLGLGFIEGRPIPDWKRFLAVAANKQALLKFLGESIVQHYRLSSLEPRKSAEMESPIAKSHTVHMKRRTLI
jgi:hypothetical protein